MVESAPMRLGVRVVQRLAICGVLLFVVGCSASKDGGDSGGGSTSPTDPGTVTAGEFEYLIGTWTGTWTDTRFNVSGSLSATMAMNGNAVEATGTIGLQSLGLGDEPGTATGTVDGNAISFTFNADTVGSGEGSVAGTTGSGMGSVLGALNFGDFTFEGTAEGTTIDGTFDFTSPTGGNGVATLTKQ
jgi:hypothetical protein